ncbi:hypothetical protein C5F47_04520 [Nitrosopumilus cobalaminigenes]|uniref:Uncharacterized protein n=1 Tax=Nitrosopumilus cobalaminigenes TaxID=1470066 RepID=A0A7D5R7Y3_9ARCH|nr:hypothetical protein [Nitrosopumilus cobalaminigenes]QLH02863.1 hypothetical protein C5F47_04520 [Nitrosopumilus cobalaminigenes]
MKSLIERFNSVNSLKVNLEKEIEDTEFQIQEYSNLLGEKIRINEEMSSDDPDFLALKAKFDGDVPGKKSDDKKADDKKADDKKADDKKADDKKADDKKADDKKADDKKADDKKAKAKFEKKKKGKKGVSDKWYNLNEILIYNGIGLKGEMELYFKAVDELKSKLENLQRTLSTLTTVMEKGLKEDMGCVAFRGSDGTLEISFLKSTGVRENFTLKSIYSGKAISVQNMIKIGA